MLQRMLWGAALAFGTCLGSLTASAEPILVNTDNFVRAESDAYFAGVVANGAFAKLDHNREMAPLDKQTVIRLNRDTLYSSALFDLDAGPVTITLPDSDGRFISLQVIDEDHFTHGVHYEPGKYTLTREEIGTRYVVTAFRLFANPNDAADMDRVHALQDAIGVEQAAPGRFEIPQWDKASQDRTRQALLDLAALLPDTAHMFGSRQEVDPVRHLIGTANAWGGNPDKDALYLNLTPQKNDGKTIYKLTARDVPVQSFWSVTVYNKEGFFEANPLNAYSLNNVTAQKDADGAITIQFGGCDGKIANCLPTPPDWNYMVRLYRPEPQILDGSWKFPAATEQK
ncbi:MAG: DUF1214 domain-containing protein [Rhizobiaceae bacterium]|nr:DUF1214 domain-containing protein [Rhizobiaceae bacterium]